jgi:nucleoside-diphosphate-sugar epimerase
VLVIGGAGYVGNVLVRRLLAAGHRVRALDCLLFDHGSALSGVFEDPAFSFVRGDLRSSADRERALDGVTDAVLLAALVGDPLCKRYPELARSVNVEGSSELLASLGSRGLDRFVFTSTCSNYGLRETAEPATEEAGLAPLSLYAETKVELERRILDAAASIDFCPTVLRVATAYGLSSRMRFDLTVSEFTRTLATGRELVVYDADTWRPYCHVDDIAEAIMTVLDASADAVAGEVFNVGHSAENYTKRMVVEAVLEHLGGNGHVTYTEGGSDPRNYRVSFDKIAAMLGFESQRRVPSSVGKLIDAIRSGAFDDVEARPRFYGNDSVSDSAERIHIAEAEAD